MKLKTEPVRGMRDVLPPESELIRTLISKFISVVKSYGYLEVIPPTIESLELFTIKSGPEIVRSMYAFKDKAGRDVCLRPELTASIARIYLKSLIAEPKPIKVFYVGNAFRYEEPQMGRYREFTQMGVEYLGDDSLYSDLELLLILRDYYKAVGLSNYTIKVNNIGILRELFKSWGIDDETQDLILHYMDKKLLDEALTIIRRYEKADVELFSELTSITTEDVGELTKISSKLNANAALRVKKLADLASMASRLRVGHLIIDLGFARGLAYYTDMIFEITVPVLNISIGGGGRYDTLIELYGGPPTPATGFALGVERTYLALEKLSIAGKLVQGTKAMLLSLVNDYVFTDEVASNLRANNVSVDVRFISKGKLGDYIGIASRKGYQYVVVVGEKEIKSGKITVKNLITAEQKECDVGDVAKCVGV